MKVIKPSYYDKFRCTANNCPQTCCQEWKIAVDNQTYLEWKKTDMPGQNYKRLDSCTCKKDGGRVIRLNEEKKCPLLDKNGLCSVVLTYGERLLSHTCDVFPRQEHEYINRTEKALVLCCPEVINLIKAYGTVFLKENEKKESKESDKQKTEFEKAVVLESEIAAEQAFFLLRDFLLEILGNNENTLSKAFFMMFYIVRDLYMQISNQTPTMEEVSSFLQEWKKTDSLAELSKAIDQMEIHREDCLQEQNELFLDMIENYRKEDLYTKQLEALAKFAENLLERPNELVELEKDFERVILPYKEILRSCAITEIYASLLQPETDLEAILVMLQWIAMEFTIFQRALCLKWKLDGKNTLSYETFREYMVVIARITGYDEADIYEYMENSFEELIWDLGYMSLLL